MPEQVVCGAGVAQVNNIDKRLIELSRDVRVQFLGLEDKFGYQHESQNSDFRLSRQAGHEPT